MIQTTQSFEARGPENRVVDVVAAFEIMKKRWHCHTVLATVWRDLLRLQTRQGKL